MPLPTLQLVEANVPPYATEPPVSEFDRAGLPVVNSLNW